MVGRPGSERIRVMASDFAAEGISGEDSRGRINDIVLRRWWFWSCCVVLEIEMEMWIRDDERSISGGSG